MEHVKYVSLSVSVSLCSLSICLSVFFTFTAAPPTCGQKQDIVITLDISQSFKLIEFRTTLLGLQYIVGALKAKESNDVNVAIVLYPSYYDNELETASYAIADLEDDCSTVVEKIHKLSYDIAFIQSENTYSYEALEYIADNMVDSLTQSTTVMTIAVSPSDVDSTTEIGQQIKKIKDNVAEARFYSVGWLSKGDGDRFDEELLALGENIPTHTSRINDGALLSTQVVNELGNASVLCSDQGKNLNV